jgi:long-chain acyl-CoA synthetase
MRPRKVLRELDRYPIGTCAEMIYRNALLHSDRECLVFGQARYTFDAFNARVNRLVNALSGLGVKKGEVIGILSWNSSRYLEVLGAAMKGGFILSPYNTRLNHDELRYLVDYSTARVLFVGDEHRELAGRLATMDLCLEQLVSMDTDDQGMISYESLVMGSSDQEADIAMDGNDALAIIYTSGTTGFPRGALYTHRTFIEDMKTYVMATGIQPEDKYVMIMPLFHIGGMKIMWSYFYVGASIVLLPTYEPQATLQAIQRERATDIHIVPTHLASFLALPDFRTYDLSSLKRLWYAASPMPVEHLKRGLEIWGPVFMQGYGCTESGPNMTCLRKEEHEVVGLGEEAEKRLLSCGKPCIGVHVRIVDDAGEDVDPYETGEIIVKGNIMSGVWRKPEETAKRIREGFLYTGDMGYYDDQGYIYIVDRKNDMIITGGENVFPREVEDVLYKHPAVREAAVIGVPDEYWVERVHAVVVLKGGAQVSDTELISFCRDRIAKYKAPKTVEFVDSLPKSSAGKILRRLLRERHGERRPGNGVTGRALIG